MQLRSYIMKEDVTKVLSTLAVLILFSIIMRGGDLRAQCYGSLMLGTDFFEFDHLARICVHFGDPSTLPQDIICSRSMPDGSDRIDVPLFAYNLHEGVELLEFCVESNDSMTAFFPSNCWSITNPSVCTESGGIYRMDLVLEACGPVCGPALLGNLEIFRKTGADPVWVDLVPNIESGRMLVVDLYGDQHYLFSPQHGSYIGGDYLYTCQEPICEEPNRPVRDFSAVDAPGCSMKLAWIAGGGNHTMIRFRTDRFPAGLDDGELLVLLDSSPGEEQYYFHTEVPEGTTLFYKAFSMTLDAGGRIARSSFVECSSVDTITASCEISVEDASWGSIKRKFE